MDRAQEIINTERRRGSGAFVAVVAAALLGAFAVVTGVADHEEPGARYVVIECQGFDALASAGARRMSCDADPAAGVDEAASPVLPVDDRGDAAIEARRKV